ncbi:MAG: NAD(P)-dependent oxidoreductase [Ignavibacteriae bacterium]|nr:NAD(P)-dependent oxidoreductase [Ignavibacteriota bacterium]
MKRVLLTGARGFIGRHCLPILVSQGYDVHAVSSAKQEDCADNVHWHQANLLDPTEVIDVVEKVRPTHLLHFAWYAVPGKYWNALENLRWVEASFFLLKVFANQGGHRAVMAGTCAEYDWRYGYCSEQTTPLTPTSVYGRCKHELQKLLGALSEQIGLSSAWGRVFFLYGPHEHKDRLVSSVICSLMHGETAMCSHGGQIRDFLYVEDVASAFVAVLESDVQGPINIASGHPMSLRDLVNKIGERFGRLDLIQLNAIGSPSFDPPILAADIRRLRDQVHWTPQYSIDEGLEQTIRWWTKNGATVVHHW